MSRLRLAALSVCSILALTAFKAIAADAKPLLVPGATVEIPGSKGKFDFLEVDSGRHRLLAAHEKDETADFIDLNSNTLITRIKLGPAVGVTVDPKTGRYFVSVQDDKRIAVIDPETLKETASVELPGETDALLLNPDNRCIYITNDNGPHMWAVNADTLKVVATIDVPGKGPECMAYDSKNHCIYLAIKTDHVVLKIDTNTNAIVAKWPTAPATGPHGLVLDSATGRVFTAGDNSKLAVIDTTTGKVIGTAEITAGVDQIAFDPSTKRIYCAGANTMSVVHETKDGAELLGNVPSALTAKNVAVDPKTHAVWTTYTDGTNSFAKSWNLP